MKYRIVENECGYFVDEWKTKAMVFGDLWKEMKEDWEPVAGPFDNLSDAHDYLSFKGKRSNIPFFKVIEEGNY